MAFFEWIKFCGKQNCHCSNRGSNGSFGEYERIGLSDGNPTSDVADAEQVDAMRQMGEVEG